MATKLIKWSCSTIPKDFENGNAGKKLKRKGCGKTEGPETFCASAHITTEKAHLSSTQRRNSPLSHSTFARNATEYSTHTHTHTHTHTSLTESGLYMVTVSMVGVGAILLSDGRLELQQNNTKHINKTTHNTLRHGLYSLHASYYVTRNIATTACVNITSYISFTLKYHFTVTIWVILTVQSKHTRRYLFN